MAKKQPHENKPTPMSGDVDRAKQDAGSADRFDNEETLQLGNGETGETTILPSGHQLGDHQLNADDSAGETGISRDHPSGPTPDAGQPDPAKTLGPQDPTVRIDATIAADGIAEIDKTLDGHAIDQTASMGSGQDSPDREKRPRKAPITVRSGSSDTTIRNSDSVTGARGSVDSAKAKAAARAKGTVNAKGSIMTSAEIGQTVNPRDLAAEDLRAWNSEVGSAPSSLPPAVDRTLPDQHADRLRKCEISDPQTPDSLAADYKVMGKLGQGGMGDVFVARQRSLDRLLALKVIKPLTGRRRAQLIREGKLESVENERRQQFLSEAIVTSDLDHPNIVPIHDVALTSSGELFYSMKRVEGTPWSDVLPEKTRDENLEILLKAADAVAFAHTRGVVHRDIKPENIMLGDFGVVMVMDWGLALPTSQYEKQDSIFATSGLGGTPAFMAPELATGPLGKIGPAADIYLLGATLYLIITGVPPHHANNVTECLRAVKTNTIRPVPEHQQGELLDIALKAMATDPADRYPDVPGFQQAIRDYRAHAESNSLAARAAEDLQRGSRNRSYADLSRAAFRFEEAIKSWPGNQRAIDGLAETKQVHARAALQNGDFDLGLSLLKESDPDHAPIIHQLREAVRERESRQSRLMVLRRAAAAMLAFILIGGTVAMYVINKEKKSAETARDDARRALEAEEVAKLEAIEAARLEEIAKQAALDAAKNEAQAKRDAIEARDAAEQAKEEAIQSEMAERVAKLAAVESAEQEKAAKEEVQRQKQQAEQARDQATMAQREAERERERALYEQYVSMIGLAKARLDRNEADGAREILESLRTSPEFETQIDRWEFRWLWHQANQSQSVQWTQSPPVDLAVATSGQHGLVALADGTVERLTISDQGQLVQLEPFGNGSLADDRATSVAIAPDDQMVAVGTWAGDVIVLDSNGSLIRRLAWHRGRVNDLRFSEDGLLFSASSDRTVRVWDQQMPADRTDQQAAYHIAPVQQIAVAGNRTQLRLVAAVADEAIGRVAVWNVSVTNDSRQNISEVIWNRTGTMTMHLDPVTAVAITADGLQVASGDLAGNVWLWKPDSATDVDYESRIRQAINQLEDVSALDRDPLVNDPKQAEATIPMRQLVDDALDRSTTAVRARNQAAHGDVIRSIRFDTRGANLVTAADDYTIKLWDLETVQLQQTLKGHGGWVVGAEFVRAEPSVVVSASNDATVRSWLPGQYVGAAVVHSLSDLSTGARQTQSHRKPILSAAFSQDGTRLVTASHDHTARVMAIDPNNLAFQQVVRLQDELLSEGTSYVAMSFGLDRQTQRLLIGSADATIRIWDLRRGTQLHEATGTGLNASFAISRDGRYLLSGSSSPDAKALLWRLDTDGDQPPEIERRLGQHDQAVTAFAISPDSRWLFTADRGGFGVLWDRETGLPIGEAIEQVRGSRVNAASFSADGDEVLIGADDEQVTIVDVATRKIVKRLPHNGLVTQLAVANDGRHALTVSERDEGDVRISSAHLWELDTGRSVVLDRASESILRDRKTTSRGQRITSAQFDELSTTVFVSHSANDETPSVTKLFSMDEIRQSFGQTDQPATMNPIRLFELPSILGSTEAVMPLDGTRLLTMNRNGGFLWDLNSQQLVKSYRAHAELTEACFSPDGRYVATASRSVKIWDAASGRALAKLESRRPIHTVQFSPRAVDQHAYVLATADVDGTVQLWHWNPVAAEIERLRTLSGDDVGNADNRSVRRVRFSPTSDRLMVVGDAGRCEIWQTSPSELNQNNQQRVSAKPLLLAAGETDLTCAAFSSDGAVVAAGATDKKVRIWKLDDDPDVSPIELIGHADAIHGVVILGDLASGMRVVTASADDTARVWDPRWDQVGDAQDRHRGREILSLREHVGDVTSVDATADGRLLMTSGRDGKVILWPANPAPENLFEP